MKRLLALLLIIAPACFAGTPTFIQGTTNTINTAAPATLAYTSNVTSGDLLIIVGREAGGTVGTVSVTDSNLNTWTLTINTNWATTNTFFMGYAFAGSSSADSVVVASTGVSPLVSFSIAEYSHIKATSPLDQSAVASSASWTAANSGNVTPTLSGELVVGGQGQGTSGTTTSTAGSSFTQRETNNLSSLEDLVQVSAVVTAATFTMSGSVNGAAGVLTFFSDSPSASPPAFSVTSGIHALPFGTTATSATGGTTIFYTLDGSIPTHLSSSVTNGGSITINSGGIVLKAIAAESGFTDSTVVIAQYGTPFNLWTSQGNVLPNDGSENYAQPNVIYESACAILSSPCFKMWYDSPNSGTLGLYYAESSDGLSWTKYSGNPISTSLGQGYLPKIFHVASTYYGYFGSSGNIQAWTSPDGLAWTVQNATAIVPSQSWEHGATYQLSLLDDVSGTWYAYYSGGAPDFFMGLATSTDLLHWTKSVSNPIISVTTSNFTFLPINGVYYGWSQAHYANATLTANGSTGIFRFSATTPSGPWTQLSSGGIPLSTYYAAVPDDFNAGLLSGGNSLTNQLGDPSVLCVASLGNCYLYFDIAVAGIPGGKGINAAVAFNTTPTQLVAGFEGVYGLPISGFPLLNEIQLASDPGTGANANPIGGHWTPMATTGGFGTAQRVSNTIEPSAVGSADSWWSGISWSNDQWSQSTAATVSSSSVGISLRQSTTGAITAYRCFWTGTLGSGGSWFIQKEVNGTGTNIATSVLNLNVGDTLSCDANSTIIDIYWNGYLVGAAIDTSITNGASGFLVSTSSAVTNAVISSWAGGTWAGIVTFVPGVNPIVISSNERHANVVAQ